MVEWLSGLRHLLGKRTSNKMLQEFKSLFYRQWMLRTCVVYFNIIPITTKYIINKLAISEKIIANNVSIAKRKCIRLQPEHARARNLLETPFKCEQQ